MPAGCQTDIEPKPKEGVDATSKRGAAPGVLKKPNNWKGKKLNGNKDVYVCESILALSAVYLLQLRRLGCMNKQCSWKRATETQGSSPGTLLVCVHVNNKADFSGKSSTLSDCLFFFPYQKFWFWQTENQFSFSSWKVKPRRQSTIFRKGHWAAFSLLVWRWTYF